ncbi:MAG TPA: deoxyribodipyrimidine photo-lyase [Steroidobacteraceae bacterium]|nr:deoxyribodipyrimidine photo-lyase [Steroidobacteraceae bacterium]
MRTAIVWFRRDLRLTDHPALRAALAAAERLVALYIHAPDEEAPWAPGGASRWWLHHSLAALDAALAARGARLTITAGASLETLLAVARASGASSVHWNRSYEPALVRRDTAIKAALRAAGVAADSHAGNLLVEPWAIKNGQGLPFRVFTPFWNACQAALGAVPQPTPPPRAVPPAAPLAAALPLAALGLLPRPRWDEGLAARWTPGEAGALARLEAFLDVDAAGYAERRDRPDLAGTSRLSPHLHFGELSARQALAAAQGAAAGAAARRGTESFLRELGWREFAQHLLYAFPDTALAPLDARFARFEWRRDAVQLAAWQRGRTGVPLVDAGMRELWHTGWMHNRVRMVVASFLTKNLGLSWLEGARWFHDTLVDADLASNTLGWQWTAGCGADAAPYYRIFNPVLQAQRFDPDGRYLRTWLPELARLPGEWLHRPFAAPAAVLAGAGVALGRDYPAPIVDLAASRERALAAWQRLRGPRPPGGGPGSPRRGRRTAGR